MRVLTLTPFYPTASDAAAGCFVAEPICALERLGIESCVVAAEPFHRPRSTANGHPALWVRYASVPGGIGLASAGVLLYAGLLAKVRELHQSRPFDIIHAHAALPCGHAATLLSRELRIPVVVTVHGLDAFFGNQVRGFAGAWCQRVTRFVYRSAARVVCISGRVADKVTDGLAENPNIRVIYNGVNPQKFAPAVSDSTRPVVLSVGNLIPIKGHEVLLRAFAALQNANVVCEIIGKGPQRSHLARLARDLKIADKVTFLGRQTREQVVEAMRRCTLFALPSRYEGLGCVYLEAMASGKATIACREQGIEEIIRHGSNGWLVNPGDVRGMTDALSALLENADLRQRMSGAARDTILQGFTLEHQAARLAQLYREVVA